MAVGSIGVGRRRADPPAREFMDGRRKRSEESRDRIVLAMLDLIGAGDVSPSAEAVAAKAGVGQRSVFRHFSNMDALYQEINRLMSAEIRPIAEEPLRSTQPAALIGEIVDRRVAIFERIMPFKVAADANRRRSPFLQAQADEFVREQRASLERALPDWAHGRVALLEGLDLVLSFDVWRRLRQDQKLSRPRARAIVERLATAALKAFDAQDGRDGS